MREKASSAGLTSYSAPLTQNGSSQAFTQQWNGPQIQWWLPKSTMELKNTPRQMVPQLLPYCGTTRRSCVVAMLVSASRLCVSVQNSTCNYEPHMTVSSVVYVFTILLYSRVDFHLHIKTVRCRQFIQLSSSLIICVYHVSIKRPHQVTHLSVV